MFSLLYTTINASEIRAPIAYEIGIDSPSEQIANAFSHREVIAIRSISLELLQRLRDIIHQLDWDQRECETLTLDIHFDIFKDPIEYMPFKGILRELPVTHFKIHLGTDSESGGQLAFFLTSPNAHLVTDLSIEGCINGDMADRVVAAIFQLKNLKNFKMATNVSGEKMLAIIETLGSNLQSLDITFTNHTDWTQALMVLPAFCRLSALSFTGHFNHAGMLQLKNILLSYLPQLQILGMNGYFEESALEPLAEAAIMRKEIKRFMIESPNLQSFKESLSKAFKMDFRIWIHNDKLLASRDAAANTPRPATLSHKFS